MTKPRSRPAAVDGDGREDRGSVTIEAAIVLAAIVVVVAACLAGIGCVVAQMRCADAAREAARLAGRGDSAGAASAVASIAPAGARLLMQTSGDLVTAIVTIGQVSAALPGVSIKASATAHREDSTGG